MDSMYLIIGDWVGWFLVNGLFLLLVIKWKHLSTWLDKKMSEYPAEKDSWGDWHRENFARVWDELRGNIRERMPSRKMSPWYRMVIASIVLIMLVAVLFSIKVLSFLLWPLFIIAIVLLWVINKGLMDGGINEK